MTTPLTVLGVTLGGVLTVLGAVLLVVAFRHGQSGRTDDERRTFRFAVAALAVGSLGFLGATVLSGGA